MKKLLAIIFALVIIFSMSTTVFAETGDSDVSVAVNSQNISVTLPLDITVTALVDGGSATVPENYEIVNNSAVPIKVDTIKVVLNDATDWAFNGTPIAARTAQSAGKNAIYFKVNDLVLNEQSDTKPTNATAWNIEAGVTKNLPIACSTSMLDQTTTESDLITITYKVSAGVHSND